jgi:hypothetical protein
MFLKGSAKFENPIHEQLITDAPIEILDGDLYHFSYDSLSDYFNRFNTYTTKISQNHYQSGTKAPHLVFLVLRPWVDFIYRYFLRLGFLDGYPGYCYALFSSCYAFVKYAKLHEIQCSLVQHEIKN